MDNQRVEFPREFVWGAATASYQIEGAWNTDGRGESIWDRFSHTPGKIENGDTGDVACNHYNLYQKDVGLMKTLGLNAYRFSVSWSRVLPDGHGRLNSAGLDFYDRLVDALLEKNIEPYVTLFHWDLPQALQDKGGWAERDTSKYFADYAALLGRRLGDRVRNWITLNEPFVSSIFGNLEGKHAPGNRDLALALNVGHNQLLAHGMAIQALRSCSSNTACGISLSLNPAEPATDSEADRHASELYWQKNEGWFLEAVLAANYPQLACEAYAGKLPKIEPGDMALIAQRLDFLGVNTYFRQVISKDGQVHHIPGSDYTAIGWEIHPPVFRKLLTSLHHKYALPPIFITESGCAMDDKIAEDGQVHDERRIAYLRDHLQQIRLAMYDGVDVRGYFVWSLMDNFEWAYGYGMRFGICYTKYGEDERIIKDSGRWYAQTIRQNGFSLADQKIPVK